MLGLIVKGDFQWFRGNYGDSEKYEEDTTYRTMRKCMALHELSISENWGPIRLSSSACEGKRRAGKWRVWDQEIAKPRQLILFTEYFVFTAILQSNIHFLSHSLLPFLFFSFLVLIKFS